MILVVEDEDVSRRALARLLEQSGYDAMAVRSAEEALRFLKQGNRPDAALVDFNLPGMNGGELIRRLKGAIPDVLSVLMTASASEYLDWDAQLPDRHYMRKPLEFSRVLSLLNESHLPH
ncbi:MAG: response regulator [Tepidisphaeraceae bacterium]